MIIHLGVSLVSSKNQAGSGGGPLVLKDNRLGVCLVSRKIKLDQVEVLEDNRLGEGYSLQTCSDGQPKTHHK